MKQQIPLSAMLLAMGLCTGHPCQAGEWQGIRLQAQDHQDKQGSAARRSSSTASRTRPSRRQAQSRGGRLCRRDRVRTLRPPEPGLGHAPGEEQDHRPEEPDSSVTNAKKTEKLAETATTELKALDL